jgi:hypothetical protein
MRKIERMNQCDERTNERKKERKKDILTSSAAYSWWLVALTPREQKRTKIARVPAEKQTNEKVF